MSTFESPFYPSLLSRHRRLRKIIQDFGHALKHRPEAVDSAADYRDRRGLVQPGMGYGVSNSRPTRLRRRESGWRRDGKAHPCHETA